MGLYNANIIGGKSAYMSAVEGGYKGTEAEFNSTLGNLGLTFSSTLLSGETTLIFEDERLTTESVLDSVYTSVFGVKIKSATFGEGTLTLEFPSQEADMEVKVVVDADVSDNLSGASGEKGADGKDGKDGVDGKSAYQYALDGGYEGTEEEFASLMANGGSNDLGEWKTIYDYEYSATSSTTLKCLPNVSLDTLKNYKEVLIQILENTHGYVGAQVIYLPEYIKDTNVSNKSITVPKTYSSDYYILPITNGIITEVNFGTVNEGSYRRLLILGR